MGNRADGKWARGLAGLLVLGVQIGVSGALPARGEEPAPAVARSSPAAAQPPVKIQADRAEYSSTENKVVFTGKVKATQGDATLTAERMEVVIAPEPAPGEDRPQPVEGRTQTAEAQSRIQSIVATQNVTFRQVDAETKKERYGVGERGEYDAVKKVMTLTGNPRVWEGKNVMTGEKMLFFLESHRVQVEGRVNLTVYPEDSPKSKEQLKEQPKEQPKKP